MVFGSHVARGCRAQRCYSLRAGVVGVVLVRAPSRKQPHPGTQLGLHVQDGLAHADKLRG
jgi:hypothetical protein